MLSNHSKRFLSHLAQEVAQLLRLDYVHWKIQVEQNMRYLLLLCGSVNTGGSSIRFYDEDAKAQTPEEPATVPIGLGGFAIDFKSIRRFAERDHKSQ